MFDVEAVRADFPILSREVNGKPLVYLDNGASAQKPQVVIDAVTRAYAEEYSNVHRGLHYLSNLATEKYEGVRAKIARFLGAASEDSIVLNSGTTEGINMVSYGWAAPRMQAGDEIVLSIMEHHANIVPWHFLRERQGVVIKWVDVDANGDLDPQAVIDAIGPRTKLVAITHMSNVLGTVVDVKTITEGAHAKGVPVLVDGSQSAVHMPVNVADLGCDFYAITGHKLYGPSGSGAIYVRPERMAEMRPFMGGGDMIRDVTRDEVTWNDPPMKFEAGTPGIVQTIGLGVALDYLEGLGMEAVAAHERDLCAYARDRLDGLNWLQVQGKSASKGAIFSFTLDGAAHAHDISTVLDKKGVAVRAGTHCAMPLMEHMGVGATCRASFGMYNTRAEVDALIDALELCHDLFG
ncbi:cysteine desulfurase [Ponticoccus sp. SC2-23]|uniref:cysteine desulfurase n=1 Tax=Alexandriicola marinus TaxID=2081710 RepID=UPI000FD8FB13|nr:cysteine desulfurase [Alexandriicola marinus]MBM1219036.1 cysteine desulfurase [Ponticoccus sp. SC6-9]MBM1223892.1 cysteine desulfurase [Ponticoccus sp. SC6-15]MBM1228850.1 cysteine desulfurase [Ponticoccus sp. SC6-38]MBM1232858.1 cysteine desulfurase [Ponticoccus sp. SC6-45]MBM1237192.1 cysteine desulfurase [Ponticoccus sp. SC6-49]MBM1241869.1 cysteine desulfurase [Ponticoccus sp. SC2-64]MBM1246382.1 cysteine desulfurase [Ponticoccus sp. SC6-42]MBM1250860.1 cysteine desulfurase [Pontico